MNTLLVEHLRLTILIIVLFIFSILSQLIVGFLYKNMIRESYNMSSTKHKLLKICKMKFSNYYEMHSGVSNIPVFVDKFLQGICIGRVPIKNIYHLSGQLMLLSVFVAGCGACHGIATGKTLGEIIPYYLLAFTLLYVYFSISAIIDIKGKKLILKTNLIDFLENNMSVRIKQSKQEQERLDRLEEEFFLEKEKEGLGDGTVYTDTDIITDLTRQEEQELTRLLEEFELIY